MFDVGARAVVVFAGVEAVALRVLVQLKEFKVVLVAELAAVLAADHVGFDGGLVARKDARQVLLAVVLEEGVARAVEEVLDAQAADALLELGLGERARWVEARLDEHVQVELELLVLGLEAARLHAAEGDGGEFVEVVGVALDFDDSFDFVAVVGDDLFDEIVAAVAGGEDEADGPDDFDGGAVARRDVGYGVECGALGPVLEFFVYAFVAHFLLFSVWKKFSLV